MSSSSFLVTGATGQQGGATARELLKHNVIVHALVRNTESEASQELRRLGCVLFQGSYDDLPAVEAALKGVKGVFLNPMVNLADPDAEVRQASNIIRAAIATRKVETMVVATSFNTAKHRTWAEWDPEYVLSDYYSRKAAVEDAVRKAGFRHWTILRPAWLMHNYLPPSSWFHFPELETESTLATAYEPWTVMPHFDAYDVGKFAAAALLEPTRFDREEIELGNEHLTIEEVANLLTNASGKKVRARYRGTAEIREMADRVPTQGFHLIANELGLAVDAKALKKYNIPLTTFSQYFEKNKEQLLKALEAR